MEYEGKNEELRKNLNDQEENHLNKMRALENNLRKEKRHHEELKKDHADRKFEMNAL